MKQKLKAFALRHKTLPLFIGFIYLYLFTVVSKGEIFGVDEATYTYHTVDFSMGFCTKILPGDLYHRLVGIYNEKAMNLYLNVLFFIFVCLVSVLLERFLTGMPRKYVKSCLFLLFLFITGPFTLASFVDEFGMLDFYWILFTVIALLFLRNKYLRWLIPVLIFLMVLVHFGSVLCYVAGLLLLMLFLVFREEDRTEKKKRFGLFAASSLTTVAEMLYFLRFESENVKYPIELFHDILHSRGTDFFHFYDSSFYKEYQQEIGLDEIEVFQNIKIPDFKGVFHSVFYQVFATLRLNTLQQHHWVHYILAVLLLFLLLYVLIYIIRNTDHKGKKMTVILMIALFFCIVLVGVFFSTDIMRWLSHAFLVLFGCLFYLLFYECKEALEKLELFLKNCYYPVGVFCLLYCFTTVNVYSHLTLP